ncbi:peroxiredoxin family protein [Seonamhaeicola sp. ML3]|uniref:TlpA family protein disulfide reductase n=1 Tax=Seonamhaeicola sp. ML3 TaxID=2937786 RepID=UPI0020108C25|nr:peroxiredoxin family protein [Seonamhaeicola sp. ML3]
MKFNIVGILVLVLTIFGCRTDNSDASKLSAYLGGEIINPSSKYIILEKDNIVIDSIRLDGRNRFMFKIDTVTQGMYTFVHGIENQVFLIEPEDSLLFRLNTLEFDESLVYTGKGAKKNNYFINEFLENEKEEKHILKLCQLNPIAFEKGVDSLKQKKLKHLDHFVDKHNPSDLFKKIANANINYQYYSYKEAYPLIQYGKNKCDFYSELPKTFYSYRKDIDYNDTFFKNYRNYKMFLRYNLSNISLESHSKHNKAKKFDWFSSCYNLERLHIIDSLVTDRSLKDELLYKYAMKYIALSNNPEGNALILKSFIEKSKDQTLQNKLTSYANALKTFEANTHLPSFNVLDYDNNIFDFSALVNSTTVINFWSHAHYRHFKESQEKISKLKKRYPEVKFISINIDDFGLEKTKQTLRKSNCSFYDQYVFKTPDVSKKTLAIYPMTKTIVIDKNKKIENHNTNIFSGNFEQQLLGMLNR